MHTPPTDLRDYGYVTGNYMNTCSGCKQMMHGVDKRAYRCRPCAEKLRAMAVAAWKEAAQTPPTPSRRPYVSDEASKGEYAAQSMPPTSYPEAAYNRIKELNAELAALRAECQRLRAALKNITLAASNLNAGDGQALKVNGERVYWQREEWVRWMLDEVVPQAEAAITAQAQERTP